jgi:hypothetical protein
VRVVRVKARARRDERGSSLLLAVIFVFVIGVILVALGGLAAGAFRTTTNLRTQRTSSEDAETAVMVAAQLLRYSPCAGTPGQGTCTPIPSSYSSSSPSCLPPGALVPSSDPGVSATDPINVFCAETANPLSPDTRVVDFYACPYVPSAANCTGSSVVLHAEVVYDDLNAEGVSQCYFVSNTNFATSSCGGSMEIDTWDVSAADS